MGATSNIVTYLVKKGSEKEFEALLERHAPTLQANNFLSCKPDVFHSVDKEGLTTFVEVLTWKDGAGEKAYSTPAVKEIWDAMDKVTEDRNGQDGIGIRKVSQKFYNRTKSLSLNRTLFCSHERAFKMFTSSDELQKWWGEGSTADAKVGGKFHFRMNLGGEKVGHHGEYLKVEKNALIEFTWAWDDCPLEATTARIEFNPVDDGKKCELVLTHDLTNSPNACEKGWSPRLDALEAHLRPVSPLESFDFNCIYASDLEETKKFYEKYFGFEQEFSMADDGIFGHAGKVHLWIGGGYKKMDYTEKSVRTCPMHVVNDARGLFARLKADGVSCLQNEPVQMRGERYWFQFSDPSGNIIDILDMAKE